MDVSEMGQTWFEIIMKWNGYRMDIDGERYSSLRDEWRIIGKVMEKTMIMIDGSPFFIAILKERRSVQNS